MNRSIPEIDWKKLSKLKPELLDNLCRRILERSENIIHSSGKSEHEKYLELYRHIEDSDQIISRCFNEWKRSAIVMRVSQLLANGLLLDEHIQSLSEETKNLIESLNQLRR